MGFFILWSSLALLPILRSNLANLRLMAVTYSYSDVFLSGDWEPCTESYLLLDMTRDSRLIVGALAQLDCTMTEQYLVDERSDQRDLDIFWHGYVLERQGQHQQALEIWQQHAMGISTYFVSLAKYHVANLDFTTSITLCTTATQIKPENIHAWQCLGESQFYVRDWESAAQTFITKLTLESADQIALFWLGRTYRYMQAYEQAEFWLTQAVQVDHDSQAITAFAWYELGHTFLAQDRHKDAISAFHHVQELAPWFLYIDNVVTELARLEANNESER